MGPRLPSRDGACGGSGDDEGGPERLTWSCPDGWGEHASGGCGPAAVLCADDGAAAEGAGCADALEASPFVALRPGEVPGGPWVEEGGPDGPPGADWRPAVEAEACPEGWRVDGAGCAPTFDGGCPAGSGALPGGGCAATATCPGGPYPAAPPEATGATVVHVSADADASVADGSADRPFAAIGAGLAAAGEGGWVLVAAGGYDGSLEVASDAGVVGACPDRVRLEGTGPAPVVGARAGARLHLRGLTIGGGGHGVEAWEPPSRCLRGHAPGLQGNAVPPGTRTRPSR